MFSRIARVSSVARPICCAVTIQKMAVPSTMAIRCFSTQFSRFKQIRSLSTKKNDVDLTNRIFTIPNIMSGVRLVLAPVIGYMTIKGLFLPGLYTFAFASALDFCDGYVARHFNQRSRLGTLIDPIADKTLMICIAASMGYAGLVHAPVAALIIGKDILMGLGFFAIAWKNGYHTPKSMIDMVKSLEIKPSNLSKINTALQMLLFITGLCRPIWGIPSVQLFLPLEAIVSCTTVGTLCSYAMTANKAVKFNANEIVKEKKDIPNEEQ